VWFLLLLLLLPLPETVIRTAGPLLRDGGALAAARAADALLGGAPLSASKFAPRAAPPRGGVDAGGLLDATAFGSGSGSGSGSARGASWELYPAFRNTHKE